LAFKSTGKLKPVIRGAVIAMTIGLGGAAFFFTGSKLGWLLALALGGLMLFRLDWSTRLKWGVLAIILMVGLGVFAVRFHKYFAAGATSAGARLDYWRAAAQTAEAYPLFGTGPGTFQRPYARLKAPDAEMARLTHNDYLEQFSDSGLIGGIAYLTWIAMALITTGRRLWRGNDYLSVALFGGLLAWFVQGFGEFSLYIPALAWTAFTLMGCLIRLSTIEFDKKAALG
jgi:O-antigen ligase